MSATDSSTNSSVKNAPERAVRLTRENSGTSSPGPGLAPPLSRAATAMDSGGVAWMTPSSSQRSSSRGGFSCSARGTIAPVSSQAPRAATNRHVQPTGGARLGSALPGRR